MSWIKLDLFTPDKPEIYAIAAALGIADNAALGAVTRFWCWADINSVNGKIKCTCGQVDAIARQPGLAKALSDVGWLILGDAYVTLPHFKRHNGATAKRRALAQVRNQRYRANKLKEEKKSTVIPRRSRDASVTQDVSPDKRRIDKGSSSTSGGNAVVVSNSNNGARRKKSATRESAPSARSTSRKTKPKTTAKFWVPDAFKTPEGTDAMAAKLGIEGRPGEGYKALRDRIAEALKHRREES